MTRLFVDAFMIVGALALFFWGGSWLWNSLKTKLRDPNIQQPGERWEVIRRSRLFVR